jgi:hypothetical protein
MIDKLGLDGLGGASVRKPEAVNKLTTLIEAAKATQAAYARVGRTDGERMFLVSDILELCALLKKAEEGLHLISLASQNSMTSKKDIGADARCALAAIKQWKEQT